MYALNSGRSRRTKCAGTMQAVAVINGSAWRRQRRLFGVESEIARSGWSAREYLLQKIRRRKRYEIGVELIMFESVFRFYETCVTRLMYLHCCEGVLRGGKWTSNRTVLTSYIRYASHWNDMVHIRIKLRISVPAARHTVNHCEHS